jgi:hypothetical protein
MGLLEMSLIRCGTWKYGMFAALQALSEEQPTGAWSSPTLV